MAGSAAAGCGQSGAGAPRRRPNRGLLLGLAPAGPPFDPAQERLVDLLRARNVRELQNFIERSVTLTTASELLAPIANLANRRLPTESVTTLDDAARPQMLAALRRTNRVVGGRSGAAARLGLKRTTPIARMRKRGSVKSAHVARNGVTAGSLRRPDLDALSNESQCI